MTTHTASKNIPVPGLQPILENKELPKGPPNTPTDILEPPLLERCLTSNKWLMAAENMTITGKKSVIVSRISPYTKEKLENYYDSGKALDSYNLTKKEFVEANNVDIFHIIHNIGQDTFKTETIKLPTGTNPDYDWVSLSKDSNYEISYCGDDVFRVYNPMIKFPTLEKSLKDDVLVSPTALSNP